MSSLSEININYEKAIAQARQLEDVAKRLQNSADRTMDGILNDVNKSWKSDSTPQYIKKGQKVKNDINTSAKNLRQIATAIRTIAKRVYEAELEAWRIANERA